MEEVFSSENQINVFVRSIKKMEIPGVLLQVQEDDKVECIYASQEFADMMDCEIFDAMQMMNGKGFIATTHPDDRLSVKRMLRRKTSDDGKKYLTIRKITAKGKEIWCKVYYNFIDDFTTKFIYVTYNDITSQKIYAERLKLAYSSIGNNFYRETEKTLAIFRVNLDKDKIDGLKGKSLFATDSIMRSYSEVIKLHAENYLIDEEREIFLQKFSVQSLTEKYFSGQSETSMYLFSRRKDGKYCYVKITAILTRHPITGEVIAFISELEASSDKVEEVVLNKILAQQFDMVSYISNGRYGVVVGDAAQIEKGNIFPTTRTGIYDDYLKSQVYPVLHGDFNAKKIMADALQLAEIEKNLRESEPYIVNIICKIEGEIYYKTFDFYTVDSKANFFVLLKSDTTEIQRKQIEQNERLKEALAEAQQANVAKSAFLSRISHEIRTPMNAIIGLDNIALHEKNLSAEIKNHLEKIGNSAQHLLTLINDILDVSRIESGKFLLSNEEFYFSDLVEKVKTAFKNKCLEKKLRFDCKISDAVENFYIGDAAKIGQILTNVLSNAVKFTDSGGKIFLSIECTAEFEGDANFKFVVKDTGVGIDKNYLPKIFDAFSQEDDRTTSRYSGSGIGMAITKNILDVMNGKIDIVSEKNVGTEVTINLPLKMSLREKNNSNTEKVADKVPETVTLEGRKILLVEDMQVNAEIMKMLLEMNGMTSEHAENGKIALEMFDKSPQNYFSAVLMDIRMPIMDGLQAAAAIRLLERDDAKTVPIIAMTANAFDEDVQRSLQAGMNAHLSKPVQPDILFQTMRELIQLGIRN